MSKALVKLGFLTVFFPAWLGATTPSLEGAWQGTITLPSVPLDIKLAFERTSDDQLSGKIDIPQQNIKGYVLVDIVSNETETRFRIEGIPGQPTFKGEFAQEGQVLKGKLHQSGATFPFEINRGSAAQTASKALEDFDGLVEKALKETLTPGVAVGVVVDGEVVLAKGYGFRDVAQKLPVTENTLFAIGSTTKAFTAALLGTMVDEGSIDWNDRVIEHLPDFKLKDDHARLNITIRDLLSHKSGLPRHDLVWYNSPFSREDLYERLGALEPTFDLRQQYQYQNLMFMVAGVLAERILEQPWEESVNARLMVPLGMDAGAFSIGEVKKSADHALPYREKEDALVAMDFRDISNVGPAGSIFSSAADMCKWVAFQLNDGKVGDKIILQQSTLRDMHTPQTVMAGYPVDPDSLLATYGLGWVMDAYHGHYRVSHDGAIDGFVASVALLPHKEMGVVVLVNKDGGALGGVLTAMLLDRLLDMEKQDRLAQLRASKQRSESLQEASDKEQASQQIPNTQPSHPLADYVAEYHNPGYAPVVVTLEEGQLIMTFNGIRTLMDHWHYDVFKSSADQEHPVFAGKKIIFGQNVDGHIDTVAIKLEPLLEPLVFKHNPGDRFRETDYLKQFVGRFELPPQKVRFELVDDHLVAYISSQPAYDLEPTRENEFQIKTMTGFKVKFRADENGKMIEAVFMQPNGSFTSKRVD